MTANIKTFPMSFHRNTFLKTCHRCHPVIDLGKNREFRTRGTSPATFSRQSTPKSNKYQGLNQPKELKHGI